MSQDFITVFFLILVIRGNFCKQNADENFCAFLSCIITPIIYCKISVKRFETELKYELSVQYD